MIDTSELWVGDILKMKSSEREGVFIGFAKDGRLRVRLREKVILVRSANVELVPEVAHSEKLKRLKEEELEKKYGEDRVDGNIDLHIEKLNPHLVNALPERIVDFQLKAFESYFSKAEKQDLKFLNIIHGRGEGVLRAHIHGFLKTASSVKNFHLTNNDGATEVIMK